MADISDKEINHLAQLAKIELPPEAVSQLAREVEDILRFVEKLQAADTEGLGATSQVTGLSDVWREDVVQKCDIPPQELLKNAPATKDGYLQVKRVLQ